MTHELSLKEAFTHFSQESRRLEKAYHCLQQQCRATDRNLNLIFDNLSEGIFFLSNTSTIVRYNPACEKILGVSQKDVLNKLYSDFFEDTYFGFSMQKMHHSCDKKVCFKHINGKEIKICLTPISEAGVLCVLEDRTPLQKLERAVAQNNRLVEIGQMAAGLAHEIRNPLGGIQGFASLLCQDLKDFPEKKKLAHKIVEGTQMLERLITSILEYGKPYEVHFVSVDLIQTIRQVQDYFTFDMHTKECFFTSQHQALAITTDPDLFKMALFNLIKNASQASFEGGKIDLSLKKEEGWVAISVRDYGCGMTLADQEHLFTPFFTTKQNGTGLGLAEAHKAIVSLSGTIEFETKENEGSLFTIRLPL